MSTTFGSSHRSTRLRTEPKFDARQANERGAADAMATLADGCDNRHRTSNRASVKGKTPRFGGLTCFSVVELPGIEDENNALTCTSS